MDTGVCTVTPSMWLPRDPTQLPHGSSRVLGTAGAVGTNTRHSLASHPGVMKLSLAQAVPRQCQPASEHCLLSPDWHFWMLLLRGSFGALGPAEENEAKFPAFLPPHFCPAFSFLESFPMLSIVPNRCMTRGNCQGRSCPHRGLDPSPSVSLELSVLPSRALRTRDEGASGTQAGNTRTHTHRGRRIIAGNATNKASDIKLMHPLRL